MSLYTKKELLKNRFKEIPKVSYATIIIEEAERGFSKLYLDTDGIVKSIQIDFVGSIGSLVLKNKHLKMRHNTRRGKIIINNPRKLIIGDNYLFKYKGIINYFKKVTVFGWGSKAISAQLSLPSSTKENIQNNENIVSTSGEVFRNFYERGTI